MVKLKQDDSLGPFRLKTSNGDCPQPTFTVRSVNHLYMNVNTVVYIYIYLKYKYMNCQVSEYLSAFQCPASFFKNAFKRVIFVKFC